MKIPFCPIPHPTPKKNRKEKIVMEREITQLSKLY